MLIPRVPAPVIAEIVTVRLAVPAPETPTDPDAPPVLFSCTSSADSVTLLAPVYVIVKLTGPVVVDPVDGAEIEIPGGVLSIV
jgi:hypothetical protein